MNINRATVLVLKLDGELEYGRREELREKLREADTASSVLLDFSGVTYADSTALAALLAFQKETRRRETRVALLAVLPQFDRLLRYAGMHDAFVVFRERGAALTYLTERQEQ